MFANLIHWDITIKVTRPEVVAYLGTDEITVTCRMLSGRSLEKVRQQATIESAASLRALGADLLKGLREVEAVPENAAQIAEADAKRKTDPEAQRKARYGSFDRTSTLVAGIVRWSCQDKVPLTPDAICEMDDADAKTIFESIVDRSAPAADAQVAEGKGAAGASTNS